MQENDGFNAEPDDAAGDTATVSPKPDNSAALSTTKAARRSALKQAQVIDFKAKRDAGGGGAEGPPPSGGGGQAAPDTNFNPGDNWGNAAELLEAKYTFSGYRTLLHQSGLLHWRAGHGWRDLAEGALDATVYPFFDGRTTLDKKGNPHVFHVNERTASNIARALKARLHCADEYYPPCYLPPPDPETALRQKSWPPAQRLVPVANGLLDYDKLKLLPHTPAYFSYGASPIVFDEFAECPTWHKFNVEIFGGDPEMMQAAQELAGYALSDLTSMQKIGLLIGPTRSGKSTWIKIVELVIGRSNVIGPSLSSLASNFPLEPFIGKKLATFADARIPEKADRKVILDYLLKISGEDTLTINRKFKNEPWTGRLPTRIFLISNELPELADTANALAARIILLQTQKSFLGSEDTSLMQKLEAELPGILNWALAGLRRLLGRGHFVQPSASADALKSLRDLSSPMSAFLAECCTDGAAEQVECVLLYHARRAWDQLQGADRRITQAQFGKQVRAAVQGLKVVQPREHGGRRRDYVGISLNAYGQSLLTPKDHLL